MASILFLLIFLITYTLWSYCVKTWKEELKHTEFLEVLLVEQGGKIYYKIYAKNYTDNEFYDFSHFPIIRFYIANKPIRTLAKKHFKNLEDATEGILILKKLIKLSYE